MGLRDKLNDKIKKKEKDIQEYEMLIREANAYIQALQEAIRVLPKDDNTGDTTETTLRPGSAVYKTFKLLEQADKPLHIKQILEGLGKENTKKERVSLSSSLAAYVRKKEIFTRPLPNTFGLVEFDSSSHTSHEPPDGFGFSSSNEDEDIIDIT